MFKGLEHVLDVVLDAVVFGVDVLVLRLDQLFLLAQLLHLLVD